MATLALNSPLKFLRFDSLTTRSFLQQATILIHCPENGVHYNLQVNNLQGVRFDKLNANGLVQHSLKQLIEMVENRCSGLFNK